MSFISGLVEKLASANIREFKILLTNRGHVSITTTFSSSFERFSKNSLFSIYQNNFSLPTFSQRFGSGLPYQYLENKNHETQKSTVLDWAATLNPPHA